jgi:hypothetical protein
MEYLTVLIPAVLVIVLLSMRIILVCMQIIRERRK